MKLKINRKFSGPIAEKSYRFAVCVVQINKHLQDKKEFVISKQFLRSGTAIGALFREAQHAESKKDFIHKLAIAQKEAHETIFWLDLLYETEYLNEEQYYDLEKQVTELFKMISSSIITTKTAVRKVSN